MNRKGDVKMSTIISVKPACLAKLSGEDSYKLLDNIMTIYEEGRKASEILETIDFYEDPEFVVDYSELFDLEDCLIEKEIQFSGFGEIDPSNIVKYARNACLYFNEACELLDVDSCSNTVMDCAEMLAKINFAVSNASTFLYNVLFDLIKYVQYLININNDQISEQTKLQYPEFNAVDINYSPEILEILRRYGEPEEPVTLVEFVNELINVLKGYRTQNTAILSYYSEYSEFCDILERYNQVDIQDSMSILMPHDVKYTLSVIRTDDSLTETVLEQLYEKLNGRSGSIDGVQSMSYYALDSLVWLAKYCKSDKDFEKLHMNERYVCSNLEQCYLCIARKNVDVLYTSDDSIIRTNLF